MSVNKGLTNESIPCLFLSPGSRSPENAELELWFKNTQTQKLWFFPELSPQQWLRVLGVLGVSSFLPPQLQSPSSSARDPDCIHLGAHSSAAL